MTQAQIKPDPGCGDSLSRCGEREESASGEERKRGGWEKIIIAARDGTLCIESSFRSRFVPVTHTLVC